GIGASEKDGGAGKGPMIRAEVLIHAQKVSLIVVGLRDYSSPINAAGRQRSIRSRNEHLKQFLRDWVRYRGALRIGWNFGGDWNRVLLFHSFEAAEPKRLVRYDVPSQGSAKLVAPQNVLGLTGAV